MEERWGASSLTKGVGMFINFVNDYYLRDVPIAGATFTWTNSQPPPPSMRKLDRFFLSSKWDSSFPLSKGLVRPRPASDHIPLVLSGKLRNGDPKPFKFENMWLKYPGFFSLIKNCWDSFDVSG